MANHATPAQDAQPSPRTAGYWAIEEREKCRARRERVLAHPDIAKRLTDPPMRYPFPEMWTGYIPGPTRGHDRPNPSPIRRQLLEICQAVAERERAQGGE